MTKQKKKLLLSLLKQSRKPLNQSTDSIREDALVSIPFNYSSEYNQKTDTIYITIDVLVDLEFEQSPLVYMFPQLRREFGRKCDLNIDGMQLICKIIDPMRTNEDVLSKKLLKFISMQMNRVGSQLVVDWVGK